MRGQVTSLVAAGVVALVPWAVAAPAADGGVASAATATSLAAATTLTPAAQAKAVYDRMTTAQRLGQLFMVGGPVTALGSATTTAVSQYHVGNLVLTGRTTSGAAPVRALTSRADTLTTSAATAGVPLLVAADQEGGYVQTLQGTGFSRMPTALTQGSWSDTTLTTAARSW